MFEYQPITHAGELYAEKLRRFDASPTGIRLESHVRSLSMISDKLLGRKCDASPPDVVDFLTTAQISDRSAANDYLRNNDIRVDLEAMAQGQLSRAEVAASWPVAELRGKICHLLDVRAILATLRPDLRIDNTVSLGPQGAEGPKTTYKDDHLIRGINARGEFFLTCVGNEQSLPITLPVEAIPVTESPRPSYLESLRDFDDSLTGKRLREHIAGLSILHNKLLGVGMDDPDPRAVVEFLTPAYASDREAAASYLALNGLDLWVNLSVITERQPTRADMAESWLWSELRRRIDDLVVARQILAARPRLRLNEMLISPTAPVEDSLGATTQEALRIESINACAAFVLTRVDGSADDSPVAPLPIRHLQNIPVSYFSH